MSEWIHRYIIIVPANRQVQANAAIRNRTGELADELTFVGVNLSADGSEPPTHFACNTAATEEMKVFWESLSLSNVYWWRMDTAGQLAATNDNGSLGQLGQPFGFAQALAAAGLARIVPPEV